MRRHRGIYTSESMQYGRKHLEREGLLMGDGFDGSVESSGDVTLADSVGTIVIKQYNQFVLNTGDSLLFTNKLKGCFLLCQNGLQVLGTGAIDGDGKGYTAEDNGNCDITKEFNLKGKGFHSSEFQLNRTSPYFFFKTVDTDYPAEDIVAEVESISGGNGGAGGGGGGTSGCAAPAVGGDGGVGVNGGPYAGGYAGGGGGGADISGAGGDGGDATDTANGVGGAVGTDGGECVGSPGLNVFLFGETVELGSSTTVTSDGGDGDNGDDGGTNAGGGGSGADGAGSLCCSAKRQIHNDTTATLDGGTKGTGGTSGSYEAGDDGINGGDGSETSQAIIYN